MTADSGVVATCSKCDKPFRSLEAFTDHLPACARRIVEFREPRFREVPDGRVPRMRQGTFGERDFNERETGVWAGRTQAERIDAGFRTGRIQMVPVPDFAERPNVFSRVWRKITGRQ